MHYMEDILLPLKVVSLSENARLFSFVCSGLLSILFSVFNFSLAFLIESVCFISSLFLDLPFSTLGTST